MRSGQPITFASAGVGTPGHLAGEFSKLKLNNKLTHVPYKGAGPALNDVVGSQVDFYFPGYPGGRAADAGRQGQTARGVVGQTFAGGARDTDRRRRLRASPISISRCGSDFFAPRGTPKDWRRGSMPRSTKSCRAGYQDAAGERRRGSAALIDRSIHRVCVSDEIDKYQAIIKAADIKAGVNCIPSPSAPCPSDRSWRARSSRTPGAR